jgi:proteic killer suppression protein
MRVSFVNKRLQKELNAGRDMERIHGTRRAKLLRQRLFEIENTAILSDLRLIPGPRLHQLHGNRKGQFSVDLDHPYRLIFVPNDKPVPVLPSGGIDEASVVSVLILEIDDPHE